MLGKSFELSVRSPDKRLALCLMDFADRYTGKGFVS